MGEETLASQLDQRLGARTSRHLTIAWREGAVVAALQVTGFRVSAAEALALARRQQERIVRATAGTRARRVRHGSGAGPGPGFGAGAAVGRRRGSGDAGGHWRRACLTLARWPSEPVAVARSDALHGSWASWANLTRKRPSAFARTRRLRFASPARTRTRTRSPGENPEPASRTGLASSTRSFGAPAP